jgi:hypothetical protein
LRYFYSSKAFGSKGRDGLAAIGVNRQAAIKAGVPAIKPTGNQMRKSRPFCCATRAATTPIAQCNSPAPKTIGQNGKFSSKFGTGDSSHVQSRLSYGILKPVITE